jgi:hypothetical protein
MVKVGFLFYFTILKLCVGDIWLHLSDKDTLIDALLLPSTFKYLE